ncbi:MAG: DUF3349 domain-containing protein [Mycobacterium sp.]
MTESAKVFENVLNWLRAGYPEGVPPKDYYPLLALLQRSLSEDQVVEAAQSILLSTNGDIPVTQDEIHQAIKSVTDHAPSADEIQQVSARLASVGWPLAASTS